MANNSQPPGAQPLWPPPAGSIGSQGFVPPQYRPAVATQQVHGFIPSISPQFRPVGPVIPASNIGMPNVQVQPSHFPHSVQQIPLGSSQHGYTIPSQGLPLPYGQANRPPSSSASLSHQGGVFSHQMPGLAASAAAPSPYSYAPPAFGQQQNNITAPMQLASQFQAPAAVQPWPSSVTSPAVPVQQGGLEPPSSSDIASSVSSHSSSSDWQEHEATNGRRYYYNKKTQQSSWEKPAELMTPIERADASTVWKEFTASDGRKYYYNKITKQSVWSIPEEMKVARERALQENNEQHIETDRSAAVASGSGAALPEASSDSAVASSPFAVTPSSNVTAVSAVSTTSGASSLVTPSDNGNVGVSPPPANVDVSSGSGSQDVFSQQHLNSIDGSSQPDIEESKRGVAAAGPVNATQVEDKASDDEPLVFSSKQEAKNAFKALLESVNVQSDWTWEQTMKEIINDKRYGALKTLGERKQAFNEYLGQRKKVEAEEKRIKQKKAREEFLKMLEECKELTSSLNWSKAVSMFEKDDRFTAVERVRDREDLFDSYMVELGRKEKDKAADDRRHNLAEFRKYLESCDFIKANSQWRKIVDQLEDDEICLRLEKIDRLLVFQDYIHDLLKEEEEQKKLQKEQVKRAERKNRDGFRKLMEEHVAAGILTAKTIWHDYCLKVRHTTEYQAVASNISGSTPKELFEDVYEELESQYHEDKTHIKDAMKLAKISVVSSWTFEDFKASVSKSLIDKPISDINLKLTYEELIERAKEKEEKAAKKRQYFADDFTDLLYSLKEITATSSWEDCKPLFEDSAEYKSMGDESFSKEVFDEYIVYLQDKAKEKERKREEKTKKEKERDDKEKRREKDRKEKDKDHEREKGRDKSRKDDSDSETGEINDAYDYKEEKRREKDRDRKHRKRHAPTTDDVYSDKDEKESKRSRNHSSDRKKSKKHGYSPDSDGESRYKRHKKESRDDFQKNGHEELEDGELGEDGEIQ